MKMNIKEETICRLCLNVADKEFEVIDEIIKDILNNLLLEINMDISKNPVICWDCVCTLKKCDYFKSVCINTRKVLPSSENVKEVQFKIEDIYEECKTVDGVGEDFDTCQFCMSPCEVRHIISDILIDDKLFVQILPKFIPNVDFDVIKMICTCCRGNLECYFEFAQKCLSTEEKINTYCDDEKIDSINQIKLSDIMYYSLRDTLKIPLEGSQVQGIKQEIDIHENVLDIKDEGFSFEDKTVYSNPIEMMTSEEDDIFKEEFKKEDVMLSDSFDTQTKTCAQTKHSNSSVRKSVRKRVSKAVMYKCTVCRYETKRKYCFDRHLLSHKDFSEVKTYKCGECNHQTKYKNNMDHHILMHKDTSETEMYKCVKCAFETKYKSSLKNHMIVHNDISKVKYFECTKCAYKSIRKGNFEGHLRIHQRTSKVKIYKCTKCPYQAKYKRRFSSHELTHENGSETQILKCELCIYATIRKGSLNRHMLLHKPPTEVYKCSECSFKTKWQDSLKRHKKKNHVHKDAAQVKMYQCTECTYKTEYRSGLKSHILKHKDPSELNMYKCAMCPYEAKRKDSIRTHLLKNKCVRKIYKCAMCTFETGRKAYMKQHVMIHRDPTQTELYKCVSCTFVSEFVGRFRKHMLTHNNMV